MNTKKQRKKSARKKKTVLADPYPKIVFRCDPNFKKKLEREARASERSLGAHIRDLINTHPRYDQTG